MVETGTEILTVTDLRGMDTKERIVIEEAQFSMATSEQSRLLDASGAKITSNIFKLWLWDDTKKGRMVNRWVIWNNKETNEPRAFAVTAEQDMTDEMIIAAVAEKFIETKDFLTGKRQAPNSMQNNEMKQVLAYLRAEASRIKSAVKRNL